MNQAEVRGPNPERDKVIALILRGRKKSAKPSLDDSSETWKIEKFFLELKVNKEGKLLDVESWLSEFELSGKREHRKESAKLLAAFFAWTTFTGLRPKEIDATAIEQLKLRFLDSVLAQMVGFGKAHDDLNPLPHWSSPNACYGWDRVPHREKKKHTFRDMAICAALELLMRNGMTKADAIPRLGKQFAPIKNHQATNGGVSTVEKTLRQTGWFRLLLPKFSDQELREIVDMKDHD